MLATSSDKDQRDPSPETCILRLSDLIETRLFRGLITDHRYSEEGKKIYYDGGKVTCLACI